MGRDNFQRRQKPERRRDDFKRPRKADKFYREKRREAKNAGRWG